MAAPDRRNIVLTGFMGTGKSAVGLMLAERLGYEWVDTDVLIEEQHGSIADIFGTRGENEFRRYERETAAELAGRDGLVISTGGRMLLDPENEELLTRHGAVVCLTASVATILERVAGEPGVRPLLARPNPQRRIEELLAERAAGYARFPQVATDGKSVAEVVDEVLEVVAAIDR